MFQLDDDGLVYVKSHYIKEDSHYYVIHHNEKIVITDDGVVKVKNSNYMPNALRKYIRVNCLQALAAEIKKRYYEGYNTKQIADAVSKKLNYKTTADTIRFILTMQGVYVKKRCHIIKYANEIKDLYFNKGVSANDIADKYGCTKQTIYGIIKKN